MDSSEHIRDVSNTNKIAYAYLNTFWQSAHTLLAANISLHCHCAISVADAHQIEVGIFPS